MIDFCPQLEPLTGSYHQCRMKKSSISVSFSEGCIVPIVLPHTGMPLLFLVWMCFLTSFTSLWSELLDVFSFQMCSMSGNVVGSHHAEAEWRLLSALSQPPAVETGTGWLLSRRCSCIELVKISLHCIKVKKKKINFGILVWNFLVNKTFLAGLNILRKVNTFF